MRKEERESKDRARVCDEHVQAKKTLSVEPRLGSAVHLVSSRWSGAAMKQLRDPAKAGTGREVSSKVGVGERGLP